MNLIVSSVSGLLASIVALPIALADIPAPGPKGPNVAQWTDTADFQKATITIAVVVAVVVIASAYGLWALRKHNAKDAAHEGRRQH